MSAPGDRARTFDELVRATGRVGLAIVIVCLGAGLVLTFAGHPAALTSLAAGLAGLVILPIVNVVAALVVEIRRRDFAFAAVALLVLMVLAYNVLRSLW